MTYSRIQRIYDELEPYKEDIVASFDRKLSVIDCIESIKQNRRIIFETEDVEEGSDFLRILREIFWREIEQIHPERNLARIFLRLDKRKRNERLATGLKKSFFWLVTWLPDRYREKLDSYK